MADDVLVTYMMFVRRCEVPFGKLRPWRISLGNRLYVMTNVPYSWTRACRWNNFWIASAAITSSPPRHRRMMQRCLRLCIAAHCCQLEKHKTLADSLSVSVTDSNQVENNHCFRGVKGRIHRYEFRSHKTGLRGPAVTIMLFMNVCAALKDLRRISSWCFTHTNTMHTTGK